MKEPLCALSALPCYQAHSLDVDKLVDEQQSELRLTLMAVRHSEMLPDTFFILGHRCYPGPSTKQAPLLQREQEPGCEPSGPCQLLSSEHCTFRCETLRGQGVQASAPEARDILQYLRNRQTLVPKNQGYKTSEPRDFIQFVEMEGLHLVT